MAGLDFIHCPWFLDSHSPPLPAIHGEDKGAALTPADVLPQSASSQPAATSSSSVSSESTSSQPSATADFRSLDSMATVSSAIALTPEQYFDLLDQLAQTRAVECQHIRRIYHLEQALDQALICLDELKAKVRDHDILQSQLSITEDFAYVQQHAIARLKAQIQEQKQALFSQTEDAYTYDEAVQTVLSYTEKLAEYQQLELEHLKVRLAQDQVEEHQRRHRLEKQVDCLQSTLASQQEQMRQQASEILAARTLSASLDVQLEASQQQVKHLSQRLAESQTQLATLHEQVRTLDQVIAEKNDIRESLQRAQRVISEQNHHIATLKRDAALANSQAEWMGQEQQQQLREQNRWQHRCLALEQERDRQTQRSEELMQQTAEMQEDILSYARQAGEYEAAVQFWKDRYHASQRQLMQLKELLEHQAPYLSEDAAVELQQALQLTLMSSATAPPPPAVLPAPQLNALEMPEFLLRRYTLRNVRRARSLSEPNSETETVESSDDMAAG